MRSAYVFHYNGRWTTARAWPRPWGAFPGAALFISIARTSRRSARPPAGVVRGRPGRIRTVRIPPTTAVGPCPRRGCEPCAQFPPGLDTGSRPSIGKCLAGPRELERAEWSSCSPFRQTRELFFPTSWALPWSASASTCKQYERRACGNGSREQWNLAACRGVTGLQQQRRPAFYRSVNTRRAGLDRAGAVPAWSSVEALSPGGRGCHPSPLGAGPEIIHTPLLDRLIRGTQDDPDRALAAGARIAVDDPEGVRQRSPLTGKKHARPPPREDGPGAAFAHTIDSLIPGKKKKKILGTHRSDRTRQRPQTRDSRPRKQAVVSGKRTLDSGRVRRHRKRRPCTRFIVPETAAAPAILVGLPGMPIRRGVVTCRSAEARVRLKRALRSPSLWACLPGHEVSASRNRARCPAAGARPRTLERPASPSFSHVGVNCEPGAAATLSSEYPSNGRANLDPTIATAVY